MTDALETLKILESAISDVGIWSWWVEDYPGQFQLEFRGVQLFSLPMADGQPPNGQYALRFIEPRSVAFLTHRDAGPDWPANWADLLHADQLKPPTVAHDWFSMSDENAIASILVEARRIDIAFGEPPQHGGDPSEVKLAFWAGHVGAAVRAKSLTLVDGRGPIPLERVPEMSRQWWDYWKAYWRAKDTQPMPRDYACEVTIPVKGALD